MSTPPVLLLAVLDGWGLRDGREGNAIAQARLPTLESLYSRYAWTRLAASGGRVGLPPGQMGNSEVGHLNLGAGRVVPQDLTRIDRAIETGRFAGNSNLRSVMERARHTALHLIGLVSDGGVHSHIRHLLALLRLARNEHVGKVWIHAILDGRDASPSGGVQFLEQLQAETRKLGTGGLASVGGRYYAMDRDNRWDRVEKAYRCMVEGRGGRGWRNPIQGVEESYGNGVYDEFVDPFSVVDSLGRPVGPIDPGQAAIFFNFRADRARQLTHSLTGVDFRAFPRSREPMAHFLTMTQYRLDWALPAAFRYVPVQHTLAQLLSSHGVSNLRLAETEKYAHVTYFFNGGAEDPPAGETRVLIPSPKVATYDLQPWMSAAEITDRLLYELDCGVFPAMVVNFANADMVGHTGDMAATVQAVEAVDSCLGRIYRKIRKTGGVMAVTADHGNAELMVDAKTGQPHTAHTGHPVPFILVDPLNRPALRPGGALEDVAPTLLQYLDLPQPEEMTGRSLLA
jgi:2,3-bisphosphoglycerate-independent phosphoglycerate mutase